MATFRIKVHASKLNIHVSMFIYLFSSFPSWSRQSFTLRATSCYISINYLSNTVNLIAHFPTLLLKICIRYTFLDSFPNFVEVGVVVEVRAKETQVAKFIIELSTCQSHVKALQPLDSPPPPLSLSFAPSISMSLSIRNHLVRLIL